jgi:hypothetical protein
VCQVQVQMVTENDFEQKLEEAHRLFLEENLLKVWNTRRFEAGGPTTTFIFWV